MSKNLVKLAVIGIAAGTCVSGQLAPIKVRPVDLASANANVVQNQGTSDDAGSGYCSSEGYGQGEAGCGGNDNCANSANCAGKGPSGNQPASDKQSSSGKQGCSGQQQNGKDATKQIKKSATQSKNMETKRKSAAARVVEGR